MVGIEDPVQLEELEAVGACVCLSVPGARYYDERTWFWPGWADDQ